MQESYDVHRSFHPKEHAPRGPGMPSVNGLSGARRCRAPATFIFTEKEEEKIGR